MINKQAILQRLSRAVDKMEKASGYIASSTERAGYSPDASRKFERRMNAGAISAGVGAAIGTFASRGRRSPLGGAIGAGLGSAAFAIPSYIALKRSKKA